MEFIAELFRHHDVRISENIEIRNGDEAGFGAYATKDILPDDIVMTVPKSSVLSPKTCSAAHILEEFHQKDASASLAVAILVELARGNESPWSDYFETLKQTNLPNVPSTWTQDNKALLQGTNHSLWILPNRGIVNLEFKNCEQLLSHLGDSYPISTSFEDFWEAMLIVSSRAFDIDNYHRLALIPGACFFNHSDRESVRFETADSVCQMCGSTHCDCDPPASSGSWKQCGRNDDASDTGSESNQRKWINMDQDDNTDKLYDVKELSGGENSSTAGSSLDEAERDVCKVRAVRHISAEDEIFSTYGDETNGALLAQYGFAIWNNLHDVVDFDEDVETFAKQLRKRKFLSRWREAQQALAINESEDKSFLGIINGESGPRISEGLKQLAKAFGLTETALVTALYQIRVANYTYDGNSSSAIELISKEPDRSKKSALIAVGTEKLLLEQVLAKQSLTMHVSSQ